MSATTTWIIEWMQCKPTEGTLTDVVVTAGWRCNGVQDTYNATIYSTCSFPMPQGDSFTPYADLTQDQVLGWCWANGVDKQATEDALAANIALQKNPTQASGVPWSAA